MVQAGELVITETGGPSVADDTVTGIDSISSVAEPMYGIVLTPPQQPAPAPLKENEGEGVSFILCGLFLLFFIIALRFRNNVKYVITMFHNVIETRTRQNVFNDTVREMSLIVLLNALWCVCAGIIGFSVYLYFNPDILLWRHRAVGMLCGMGIAVIYSLFMWWVYAFVGWIFSDSIHSRLWVKGFSACQALTAPALLLTALVGISTPEAGFGVGVASLSIFLFGKLIFIWKGYKIFFEQFSSGVLFICYLCSLEIVPLILCYRSAVLLGKVL